MSKRGIKSSKSSALSYIKTNYDMYLLLIPGTLYILIFRYLPMGGIIIAFQDYSVFAGDGPLNSIFASPWVGFEHFKSLFVGKGFYNVFRNTLLISVYKIIFITPLPISLAIILNELRNLTYKKILQTILYLPNFMSWVVVGGIFVALLSSTGPVNGLLSLVGIERKMFLIDRDLFRPLLVVTDAWKGVGWGSIIYLAAISGIDTSLYEAATIDGASRFKRVLHITLPGIAPTFIMLLVLRLGQILNAGFEQIFVLYNPIVYEVADIIGTYIYRKGLGELQFSFGTAVGLFNSVIAITLILVSNSLARRVSGRSIW